MALKKNQNFGQNLTQDGDQNASIDSIWGQKLSNLKSPKMVLKSL